MDEHLTVQNGKPKFLTILQLIQDGRALTATSSLHFSLGPHFHPSSYKSVPRERQSCPGPSNAGPTTPQILAPLNQPAMLIGILTLPTLTLKCPNRSCLQFSDNSSTICCDIIDFDARVIGKRIRVLAWNFIPSNHHGGFLEIIEWKLLNSGVELGRSSRVESFPLLSGSSCASEYNSKHSYFVHGTLESISPVSVVPCSFGKSNKVGDSSAPVNIRGFLVRIIACECNLCASRELMAVLHDSTFRHSFTKPLFIYFCGSASCWHPVITKLVGGVVSLSRLKKKLIFMGKDESQLMFVTTENSILHLPSSFKKRLPYLETVVKGKGESSNYTGIIKGVYMEGMVIELDKEAWLLLSDRFLIPPHSLRVGAVVSVRNVHFVKPKFSWTKVLILGACFRTSIMVESFSPLETEHYIVSQSQDSLAKFIESLAFPARFWALLVISCFRKKFAGILSEKEIFGSENKEGLAKMYINSHLSSSMFQDRHGVFVEFCRHESCGCNSEIYCSNLKLVVPFSTFIHHGEAKWMKMLLRSEKNNIFCDNNCSRLFSLEEKSYSPSKRRILISEDLGFVLLGHLKIAASGRLQLLDGTGSIDVIISDLRPAWEENSIYELLDYRLIVDGIPELVDHLKLLRKSITCRSVFHCLPVTRERAASPMFIDLSLRGSKCRNIPFYSSLEWKNDLCEFESGAFHLFLVTHKFPALLNSGQMRSNISSTFVEAIILPWDLTLAGKDGAVHLAKFSRNQISEQMEHYAIESNEHAPIKKQRTSNLTDKELTSGFLNDNLGSEFKTSCSYGDDTQTHGCGNLSNSREIRCMATVRCVNNSNLVTSGILYHAKLSAKVNVNGKPHAEKVLLQFQSESSAKYHWLQIGGYYIMKHHIEDSFCKVKKIYEVNSARVLSSTSRIWSLCLSFDYAFTSNKSIHDTVMGDSSFNRNDILLAEQDELLLQGAPGSSPGTFSDVSLHLPSDAIDILHVKLKELEENLIKPAIKPEEAYNFLSSRTHLHSMPSGSYSNCLFPEGNLVSLNGDVIAIHGLGFCTPSVQSNCEDPNNVLQLRFLQGHGSSCIHVMVDHQTVKISGFLSRHTYLTGFGPGTNATFHRILEVGGQDRLMLTPISFIVINSLRVVDDLYSERWSSFPASAVHGTSSVETISFGLISELIPKCMDYKPVRFLCKVIAINLLVLEKFEKYDNSKSSIQSRPVPIDIPLAGFVLDDGSSTCFCWANAERAATLLRLREELPQTVLEYCGCTLKWVGIDKTARGSIMYHLGRILEKHKRITVKTHGSMADSSFPELTVFASSDNKLTSSDENLLKFIVLHACFCISWTVVACMMDPDAVRHLEREHLVEVKTVHSVKNMWAREVCHTNSLTEARNIIQELLNR